MQEKLCAVNYPTKLACLATLCHPSCTFWSMLQPIFNCPYPLDQSYLSLSCHLPPLCMLPGCINLLQQLLIALDFPCWQGGSVQLRGSFPISTHAALHGLLSVAYPEVSYPNGHAWFWRQSWCHPHSSAAAGTRPGQESTKGWNFPRLLFQL